MAQNSTPTFSINIESLAPEVLGAGLSPAIFFSNPQSETIALGPYFQLVIDAGTASASPATEHTVDYDDIFVYSIGSVAATGLNIIQYADYTQLYVDELVLDVEDITPLGSGSILLGSHTYEVIYLPPTSYSMSIEESSASVINPHSALVTVALPSGAPAGTVYNFIAASGQIRINSSNTRMFVGPSGWFSETNQHYTLPVGATSAFVCNGLNDWFNTRPNQSHYFS